MIPDRKDWPESIQTSEAFAARQLPDGRWACLNNMALGNVRMNIVEDPDDLYAWSVDFYCYHNPGWALLALMEWTGEGDPWGWVRHFGSARRRDYEGHSTGRDAYREWVNP